MGKAENPEATAATVVIGEHVAAGCEERHRAWQSKVNQVAATFPGFIGAEVRPPDEPDGDWTVVYQFDSVPHLQSWLNSVARQELLDEGADLHDRPATQQVVVGSPAPDELVTVVVSHRVDPACVDEFLAWQRKMTDAERDFDGFKGSEIFRPVPGVQDEWTAVYRFDTGEHLEAWLDSETRHQLLEEGAAFKDYKLRTIRNSFGNWFDFAGGDEEAKGPGSFATSIAVWVGLYPTVMVLTLAIAELFPHSPLWQTLIVGNLVSSFAMTYISMPWYANRILRSWLTAGGGAAQPATTLKWLGVSALSVGAWAVFFWLVTTRIWHLP